VLIDENISGDKVEFTIRDTINEKIDISVSRNNRSLNECIEEWYAAIENDFRM